MSADTRGYRVGLALQQRINVIRRQRGTLTIGTAAGGRWDGRPEITGGITYEQPID